MNYVVTVKSKKVLEALLTVARENGYTVCKKYEQAFESGDYPNFAFNPNPTSRINIFGIRALRDEKKITLEEMFDKLSDQASKKIEVVLNDQYTARVTDEHVEVGCQKFTHTSILLLADAIKLKQK